MEDLTWAGLETQIRTTQIIQDKMANFDPIQKLILENQLAIMKALNKLDDKIRNIPQ
jgi:hypothetical protein